MYESPQEDELCPSRKAATLQNAQFLNKHLTSDHKQVEALARLLYDQHIDEKYCPTFNNLKDTIKAIILNLYSAYINDESRYVRYSRKPKRYTENRYNYLPMTWRKTNRVISALSGTLIEHHLGIPGYGGFKNGKQSRIRAKAGLIKLMLETYGFQADMIQRVDDEVIILKGRKDADGYAPRLEYPDTTTTRRMRKNLKEINVHLADTGIDIFLSDEDLRGVNHEMGRDKDREPIDFRRKRLRRIFNNRSFKFGGRFYHGWWQEVPRKYRSYIQINGKQTEELDFSGMHFAIFYAQVGRSAPSDPYTLPDMERQERGLAKKALNAMINASTEESAIKAIRKEARQIPFPAAYPTAEDLVCALREMHEPIDTLFCTGEGLHAQFLDSRIAEYVMLKLLRQGVAALPVHDSFIVVESQVETLREAMSEAFEEIIQSQCGIDAKTPHWHLASDAFPVPDQHKRLRKTIEGGKFEGFLRRELYWDRQLRTTHARRVSYCL